MGVLAGRLKAHEVDHVDDAHLQVGQVLADQVGRGQGLERRDVARARHDHVGLALHVRAGPVPSPQSPRAVRDRIIHREVVQSRLLAGHDHVDVVAAAQAVIADREQRVRVRREVHANDLALLVHGVVDEARVLVGEPVVVLAPHV